MIRYYTDYVVKEIKDSRLKVMRLETVNRGKLFVAFFLYGLNLLPKI